MLEELLLAKDRNRSTASLRWSKGKRPRHQLRLVFVSAFGRKSLYGMKESAYMTLITKSEELMAVSVRQGVELAAIEAKSAAWLSGGA